MDDQYHVDVGKTGEKLMVLDSDLHNDVLRQSSMRTELSDLNILRTLVKRAFLWRKEEKADS